MCLLLVCVCYLCNQSEPKLQSSSGVTAVHCPPSVAHFLAKFHIKASLRLTSELSLHSVYTLVRPAGKMRHS